MLRGWTPAYDLPIEITPAGLDRAAANANTGLAPVTTKELAVIMDRLFSFTETFGIKDAGIRKAMQFYRETLSDVPADLLVKSVDGVIRTYKYGHRLPVPADLRTEIEDDLRLRLAARNSIETARRYGRYADTPLKVTDEDRAKALAAVAEARRILTGKAAR